jgi:hypothetical protein
VNNEFGYQSMFNGVGVYVFAYDGLWYMTVYQDLGVTEITYDLIKTRVKQLKDGKGPGCEMKPLVGQFTVKISVNSNLLDVEVKQGANVYSCVQKAQLKNLRYQGGYLGFTSANRDLPYSSIDVIRTQLWNMSPAHYRKEEPKSESSTQQTDLETEAVDILSA